MVQRDCDSGENAIAVRTPPSIVLGTGFARNPVESWRKWCRDLAG